MLPTVETPLPYQNAVHFTLLLVSLITATRLCERVQPLKFHSKNTLKFQGWTVWFPQLFAPLWPIYFKMLIQAFFLVFKCLSPYLLCVLLCFQLNLFSALTAAVTPSGRQKESKAAHQNVWLDDGEPSCTLHVRHYRHYTYCMTNRLKIWYMQYV